MLVSLVMLSKELSRNCINVSPGRMETTRCYIYYIKRVLKLHINTSLIPNVHVERLNSNESAASFMSCSFAVMSFAHFPSLSLAKYKVHTVLNY